VVLGGHLRIGLDATPLLGPRTGVGRYVASLLDALAQLRDDATDADPARPSDDLVAAAFTLRGRASLPGVLPPGVRAVGPPVPARLLHRAWQRFPWPPLTGLTGSLDVFHATNFVLPPPGRAAGVVTVHDLSFLTTPETVTSATHAYRTLVPRSIERAALVITPSHAIAAEVADTYGVSQDRLVVTHLGVDAAWFDTAPPDGSARRSLGLPERYFLFAGNLEPRKNLPLLLSAYRAALHTDPELPALVLVGPPGWGPALDTRGIPETRLRLLGYQADDDLRRIVAGAEALVYPSQYEGFGLPPLEAFACGVPVIASDLPVVEEVLGPDRTLATRVPVGDLDALAEALLRRASTTESPNASEARRRRAQQFSWHATARTTQRAYIRAIQ
jgi:glycosyltransferase involved in cell wall biosynthesis